MRHNSVLFTSGPNLAVRAKIFPARIGAQSPLWRTYALDPLPHDCVATLSLYRGYQ
jgi:hypothetical protein